MRFGMCLTSSLLASTSAFAQQAVQQPVFSTTSVNTTVSVPDRGSAFLGGVTSAQSARSQYGPLRSGTSSGRSRQTTSITTNVYIHDLQAMDEALLNSGPSESSTLREFTGTQTRLSEKRDPVKVLTASPAEKATKFEQLAEKANRAGKHGVAKLHWQIAAKYGSKLAETRLEERTRTSSTHTTATQSHE